MDCWLKFVRIESLNTLLIALYLQNTVCCFSHRQEKHEMKSVQLQHHVFFWNKTEKQTQAQWLLSSLPLGYSSWVAAPWLSSANLIPTRIECLRNFSAHRLTQVSSCFCSDLCLKVSTQSLKHLSTSELYILKLQEYGSVSRSVPFHINCC